MQDRQLPAPPPLPLWLSFIAILTAAAACGTGPSDAAPDLAATDLAATDGPSSDLGRSGRRCSDPFADRVVSFHPGDGAGFGQDRFPEVVLGPPVGGGKDRGGLDVLSLGRAGEIVLEFTDIGLVDGPGPDLLVFENPFGSFVETGSVAVSDDLTTWAEWPCDATDPLKKFGGCAGVSPVLSAPENGIPATDPAQAGGDAFDLAQLHISRARYVRIRDSGQNQYGGISGGFDLDAVAVVNGAAVVHR